MRHEEKRRRGQRHLDRLESVVAAHYAGRLAPVAEHVGEHGVLRKLHFNDRASPLPVLNVVVRGPHRHNRSRALLEAVSSNVAVWLRVADELWVGQKVPKRVRREREEKRGEAQVHDRVLVPRVDELHLRPVLECDYVKAHLRGGHQELAVAEVVRRRRIAPVAVAPAVAVPGRETPGLHVEALREHDRSRVVVAVALHLRDEVLRLGVGVVRTKRAAVYV